MRPVFRSLNKPLLILGGERRLMIFSIFVGAAFYQVIHSLVAALVVMLCVCALAWIQARNPVAIRLLANHWTNRRDHCNRYDPAVRRPFHVIFYDDQKSI